MLQSMQILIRFLTTGLLTSALTLLAPHLAAPVFAQLLAQQISPSPTTQDMSFHIQSTNGTDISLKNLNINNNTDLSIKGVSLLSIIPNGTPHLQAGNTAKYLDTLIKLQDTKGSLLDKWLHLPTKDKKVLLHGLNIVASGVLNTIANNMSTILPTNAPQPTASLTPVSLSSPIPLAPPTLPPSNTLPTLPTSLPTPPTISQSTNIHIDRIQVCPPKGEKQWIQFRNTDTAAFSLEKWHIKNSKGHSHLLHGAIGGQSTGVITFARSFFIHTGDTLTLIDPNENIIITMPTTPCATKSYDTSSSTPIAAVVPTMPSEPVSPSTPFTDNQITSTTHTDLPNSVFTPPITSSTDTADVNIDDTSPPSTSFLDDVPATVSSVGTNTSTPLPTPTSTIDAQPPATPPNSVLPLFFLLSGGIVSIGSASYVAYHWYTYRMQKKRKEEAETY